MLESRVSRFGPQCDISGQILNLVPRVLSSVSSLALQKSGKSMVHFFTYVILGSNDGKTDGRKGLTVYD